MKFDKIRLLETGYMPGPWNMALDEILLMNFVEYETPILRLYGWSPPAVSIGYFQSLIEEVDVEKCKLLGIDVVRRITGGGAVLHEFELTYSFISRIYPRNIMESYILLCKPVAACMNKLGFDAKYVPLNDIIIDGKKVSGNAQTRKNDTLLQHGTILLDVDFDKMFSVLKVPQEKIKDKMIKEAKARVMGLNKGFDEVAYALTNSFGEILGAQLFRDNLTKKEKDAAQELAIMKYSSRQWNWKK